MEAEEQVHRVAVELRRVRARRLLGGLRQVHIPHVFQVQEPGRLIVVVQRRDRYVGLGQMAQDVDEGQFRNRGRGTAHCFF